MRLEGNGRHRTEHNLITILGNILTAESLKIDNETILGKFRVHAFALLKTESALLDLACTPPVTQPSQVSLFKLNQQPPLCGEINFGRVSVRPSVRSSLVFLSLPSSFSALVSCVLCVVRPSASVRRVVPFTISAAPHFRKLVFVLKFAQCSDGGGGGHGRLSSIVVHGRPVSSLRLP